MRRNKAAGVNLTDKNEQQMVEWLKDEDIAERFTTLYLPIYLFIYLFIFVVVIIIIII